MGKIIASIVFAAGIVYLLRHHYIKRLEHIRDHANFTTVRGQAKINACNAKLDFIRGYGVFKRKPNREDT